MDEASAKRQMLKFLVYMKSIEESRGIIMYTSGPDICPNCGEQHVLLSEFYYHFN